MKKFLSVRCAAAFSILISILSCSHEKSPMENEHKSQLAFVMAEYKYSLSDGFQLYTYCSGVVLAQEIPLFEFFKLGDRIFKGSMHFQYFSGGIQFYNYFDGVSTSVIPLEVEVKTAFGSVIGVLSVPDTLKNVVFSATELTLGQSLTINWDDSRADFYIVSAGYYYLVDGSHYYINQSRYATTTFVTFDGSVFTNPGHLMLFNITPTNGPLPDTGARPNMSGAGKGFFYYLAGSNSELNKSIDVGGGSNISKADNLELEQPHNSRDLLEEFLEKLTNRIK